MGSLRLVAIALLLASPAFAQSPTYGIGRTPSAEEVRAADINIGPEGKELPPGRGSPKEGAKVFELQGCVVCHCAEGVGGLAPALKSKTSQDLPIWKRERMLPLRAPFATTVWDYVNRAMPFDQPGLLKPPEVYAVVAYILNLNGIIGNDQVMDAKSLPKVKMPNRDGFMADPRPDVGKKAKR